MEKVQVHPIDRLTWHFRDGAITVEVPDFSTVLAIDKTFGPSEQATTTVLLQLLHKYH